MSVEPGQIIDGKYRVIRRIGEGGMGTVYEGENSRIGRRVAIKVLHANVAAMPEFVERFEHEARAAARIGSPFVCDVLDLGDLPGGDRYIVMEYLDGVSFEDRVGDGGKLTCAQLAPIAFELLEGLGTMHNARVIHRDLKPANVFLSRIAGGRGEVVKILDFGVAKLLPMSGEVGSMTQTGTMMGTPLYMSPEQARGAKDVDGRTDLYAASVMFYRALTGVLPYNADTLNELLFKIVLEDPKPLRDVAPEVDERFAEIVHKGLARDLKDRWESARDYQEAIAAWGRAQGRQSLAFAVTAPLDGALSTGANYSRRAPSNPGLNPGSQPGNATGNGTPIAWSEDAPRSSRVPSGQATVMDALGATPSAGSPSGGVMAAAAPASATPATVKHLPLAAPAAGSAQAAAAVGSAARAGLDGNAPPATSTLASPLESSKDGSAAAEPPVANATTVPTAPIADLTRAPSASAPSKRGLVFGAAGAGAIGLVAFLAFGRGGAPAPAGLTPAAGTGESTAASSATTATEPSAATSAAATASPSSAATAAASTSAGAADPSASASASATAPPIAGGSHGTSPRRTNDGAARPGTTTATGTTTAATATAATTAATVTAAPPPASAATAKPAGSARKFRTNID